MPLRGKAYPMWDRLEQREISRRDLQPGPGERPRPDLPDGADLIPQIKHIVVLMMENHSYDNYLGTLPGRGDGLPTGPDGVPNSGSPSSSSRLTRRASATSASCISARARLAPTQ